MMARPLLLLLLLGALLSSVSAKPKFRRHSNGTATTTSSAVRARQVTRERILGRTDKLVMANLFGREDCSIPQPSTGVCSCGLSDFDSALTCGGCNNPCEGGESCCDGSCVDLSGNHDNCGACGNPCEYEELCCNGQCIPQSETDCGVCGGSYGQCVTWDDDHCGDCITQCFSPYFCFSGYCDYFDKR
ncbi:hypothetical protein EXIGLDRAFT_816563 [Exidia glandulosa HHB12029]|uniref:Stig1-domain-containing protein n=1 Tax=Exidia glandulosa HHB12029 TaxID=1314781 RepID=A0A165KN10_EXIGL|nr:hypothetical protein EXIGLDRAFT_816563 [Exidia glandulosa HHB12029]